MIRFRQFCLCLIFSLVTLAAVLANPLADKVKVKNFLLKTNRTIGFAHMVVKKTKNYTGKLSQSVAHERLAKKYYNDGQLEKSLHHSYRARFLASEVISESNAKPPMDASFTAEEQQLTSGKPSDQELDEELAKELPESTSLKDEDLLSGNLDIEIQ
jgi:hypothetical protein